MWGNSRKTRGKIAVCSILVVLLMFLTLLGFAATAQKTTIRMMTGIAARPWRDDVVKMVSGFAESNPDIKVEAIYEGWDTFFDKLNAMYMAGDPPEVQWVYDIMTRQYAVRNQLKAVDEMFGSEGLPLDDFVPSVIESLTYQGKIYGVPLDTFGTALWYNNQLVAEAGLNPMGPGDAEEFLEYAKKLTVQDSAGGIDQYGFGVGSGTLQYRPFALQLFREWGGDILAPGGESEVILDSEGTINAMRWIYDLVAKHKVAPSPVGIDQMQSFAGGKLAMVVDGFWMGTWADSHPEASVGFWQVPQIGPKKHSTVLTFHLLQMPAQISGAKYEASKRFVEYMANNSVRWALGSYFLPARISLRSDPLIQKMPVTPLEEFVVDNYGEPEVSSGNMGAVMIKTESAYFTILNGDKTPDQALKDAAAEIRSLLK